MPTIVPWGGGRRRAPLTTFSYRLGQCRHRPGVPFGAADLRLNVSLKTNDLRRCELHVTNERAFGLASIA